MYQNMLNINVRYHHSSMMLECLQNQVIKYLEERRLWLPEKRIDGSMVFEYCS